MVKDDALYSSGNTSCEVSVSVRLTVTWGALLLQGDTVRLIIEEQQLGLVLFKSLNLSRTFNSGHLNKCVSHYENQRWLSMKVLRKPCEVIIQRPSII